MLAEDQRVPAIVEQNTRMTLRSAAVLDAELAKHDYLVEDRFTVTDIIVGYTVNWIEADGHLARIWQSTSLLGPPVREGTLHTASP